MATTARTAGVNAEVSMKARARRWEVSYARLEDATPTIWDPACVINDAAAPGTGLQLTGTIVTVDADRSQAIVDVTPGAVFRHNVRTANGYAAGGAENSWAAILEGSPVYYDRSAVMPAGCYLSLSPIGNTGVPNVLFGFVVLDPLEVPFLARAAGAGNTFGCAVMQFPALLSTTPGVAADVVALGALTAANPNAATSAAFPAGGVGAAAGGWDTAINRDLAIAAHAALLVDAASLRVQLTAAVADLATLRTKLNLYRTNLMAAGLMA